MKAFDNSKFESYKAEAQERWGNTQAYKEHAEKTKDYGTDKWSRLTGEMDLIFHEFALCLKNGSEPCGADAQALVKKLQDFITEHYYTCTGEILLGLGQMYVGDARFQKNIDRHAAGTANFVCEAITRYSKKE